MERLEKLLTERFGEKRAAKLADRFSKYMEMTLDWNEKVNLTSITEPAEFVEKHFLDSLSIMDSYEIEDAEKIIDIGTGGGFPGIPLAIVFPEKKFTLVDSLDKRMKIVQQMADEIGLKNVTTVHGRAEDLGQSKQYREKFELCVSRAVANLSTLSEYCLPFVKVEGSFIAFKGPDAEEEAMGAENAIMELGGALADIEEAGLFMDDGTDLLADVGHMLVHIDKESKTPKKYPRKAGTPSKNPLK